MSGAARGIMRPMPHLARSLRLPLALLLALATAGCGGEDPAPAGDRPIVVPAENPDVASAVADPTTPRIVSIVANDGQLSGDTGTVEVKRNVVVRLVIISDEAGTAVVQGYDLEMLVTAESPAQLDFIANRAGDFPVVFEGRTLTTLRVG